MKLLTNNRYSSFIIIIHIISAKTGKSSCWSAICNYYLAVKPLPNLTKIDSVCWRLMFLLLYYCYQYCFRMSRIVDLHFKEMSTLLQVGMLSLLCESANNEFESCLLLLPNTIHWFLYSEIFSKFLTQAVDMLWLWHWRSLKYNQKIAMLISYINSISSLESGALNSFNGIRPGQSHIRQCSDLENPGDR